MLVSNENADDEPQAVQLTRSYVIEQLQKMGYERDFLPDSVIDAFIQEINSELETEETTQNDTEPLDEFSFVSGEAICRNENNQIIVKNARNPSGSKYTRDVSQMMERLDAIDLSTTDEIESFEKQSYDDDHDEIESFEKQSYDDDFSNMTEYSEETPIKRPGCTFYSLNTIVIRPSLPPRKKKTDPVSRFHQHQKAWAKDSFLKRASDNKSDHPAAGSFVKMNTKPRHNYASMRSNYVVPTSKPRRDVIWEVRSRMAEQF